MRQLRRNARDPLCGSLEGMRQLGPLNPGFLHGDAASATDGPGGIRYRNKMNTLTICPRAWVYALALVSCCANAQHWDVRKMLSATSGSIVNLNVRKGADVTTVDTIQRQWVVRMAAVSDRLSPAYGLATPDLFITKQNSPNAFVTFIESRPTMVMNTEMLRLVGDDEDMMAAVIGHELGHLKANHLTDGRAKAALVSLLGILAGAVVDYNQAKRGVDTGGAGMALGNLGGGLVNAKFSRDQEREADDIGVRNMASVGFDPNASARLWKIMESKTGGGGGVWLDSHPSHAERFQSMQVAAAKTNYSPPTVYATVTPSSPPTTKASAQSLPTYDPFPISAFVNFAVTSEEMAVAAPGAYRRGYEALRAERHEESFAALNEAAENLDERALALIGDALRLGRGTTKDLEKSYDYYSRSASKGFAPAIYGLGEASQFGVGRPVDIGNAVQMYAVAQSRGHARASARLAMLYANGTGVEKSAEKAREMAMKASDKGDAMGRALYGAMLRDGTGGPSDSAKGFELLSNIGDPKMGYAHYQLGLAYERGVGTYVDKDKAAESYRRALANGVPNAKQRLEALGFSE